MHLFLLCFFLFPGLSLCPCPEPDPALFRFQRRAFGLIDRVIQSKAKAIGKQIGRQCSVGVRKRALQMKKGTSSTVLREGGG